ncbi:Uncharacterised protein [Burkholderia pseudomallei]|nr:Uncharacterised protein [Burkholderia pseudomallei]CAJ3302789.1 Uncharacterised protein [Burkholderia pseudomallei]CAJ3319952.1 Uncharacterised protein [Burkholderia pseudomallei]CAJ3322756.1 Uncharacterised protein [Burkholderia pseudomallei]CAJ3331126.1 Uncharacterised protein [Burkholderia pseudomallei]
MDVVARLARGDRERLLQHALQRRRDLRGEPALREQQQHRLGGGEAFEHHAVQPEEERRPCRAGEQREQRRANAPARAHRLQQRHPSEEPGAHDEALVKLPAARAMFAQITIERIRLRDLLTRRLRAHRHVADELAVANHGCRVRAHPVMIAVLAAVLDDCRPRAAGLQRRPHVGERFGRHVGMPNEIVRLADDFVALEPAHLNERGVRVRHIALRVGRRHQGRIVGKIVFPLSHWKIGAHVGVFSVRSATSSVAAAVECAIRRHDRVYGRFRES